MCSCSPAVRPQASHNLERRVHAVGPILQMGRLRSPGVGLREAGHLVPAQAPAVPSFPVWVVGGDSGREAQEGLCCRSCPRVTKLQRSRKRSLPGTAQISDASYKFQGFQKSPSGLINGYKDPALTESCHTHVILASLGRIAELPRPGFFLRRNGLTDGLPSL